MADAEANRALIRRLYAAFDEHDGDAMARCYAPGARYRDPVFGVLSGEEVGRMWRMLAERGTDLRVELLEHDADAFTGHAHWKAHYTFSRTGRPVVNDIHSRYRFERGLIAEQVDSFSFFGWARQALGRTGLALGWTRPLRGAIRRTARRELARHGRA